MLPTSSEQVGVDLGVTHLAALSDGTFIDHPRYFRRAEKKLALSQQVKDRKKKGSHRHKKAKRTGREASSQDSQPATRFSAQAVTQAGESLSGDCL